MAAESMAVSEGLDAMDRASMVGPDSLPPPARGRFSYTCGRRRPTCRGPLRRSPRVSGGGDTPGAGIAGGRIPLSNNGVFAMSLLPDHAVPRRIRAVLAAAALSLALSGPAIAADTVDINTADAETITRVLSNIGPSKAQAIVDYRDEHGPFKIGRASCRASVAGALGAVAVHPPSETRWRPA